jgi:SAM-dependent methyltransferase
MTDRDPAFATDAATRRYYEQRADEYDEWYRGEGKFAARERPGWHEEVGELRATLAALDPARTLDVACGTAYLSASLRGPVLGLDQSRSMAAIARGRIRGAVVADALELPVATGSFDRVFTGHFYGHLPAAERERFLAEARRVGAGLVVVDSARRAGLPAELWQERVLNDGSRHSVFKRFLGAAELADELGVEVLFDGAWFVAAGGGQRAKTRATSARAIDTGTTTAPAAL